MSLGSIVEFKPTVSGALAGGGLEFVSDVPIQRIKHGTADVNACVVIVFAASVCCGDCEDLITSVGDLGTVGAIIVLNESSGEHRDGGCGDIPMEGSRVDKRVHRR
jgi:hypothetical protein